ncbi:hypothetical protein Thiowin_02356 [Thiorhodovibrio winogradskyi]|uniref:Transposase n=1 Tax=Thiorhodovibrio winogradskyi TaxID=77007 RepID=A0ABZ0SCP4_9GAMM
MDGKRKAPGGVMEWTRFGILSEDQTYGVIGLKRRRQQGPASEEIVIGKGVRLFRGPSTVLCEYCRLNGFAQP